MSTLRTELKPIYLDEPERIAFLEAIEVAIRYEVAVHPYGDVDTAAVSILRELRERIRNYADCDHPPLPDEPYGYMAWLEWAEKKTQTHRQKRCPGCGLWVIWEPKPDA